MASINMPTRRQKRDPMETIMSGLQIASSIYGIKEAGAKADLLRQEMASKQKNDQAEMAMKEATLTGQGYQKNVGEDGTVSYLRPPGYKSLDDQTKEAQLAKTAAETDAIRKGRVGGGDPETRELRKLVLQQQLSDAQRKAEEARIAQTPQGRLKGLNSGDKARVDNAKLGLSSVQGMADALLKDSQNTFSVFGENDFTQQRTLFEEALGRMQSGGAISKEEEERFKNMAPTWRDSADMQKKKLVGLQKEMASRLQTLGFSPEDVDIQLANYATDEEAPAQAVQPTQTPPPTNQVPVDVQKKAQEELIKRQGLKAARMPGR